MIISPHINKKTGKPYSNIEYVKLIKQVYDLEQKKYETGKVSKFKSPLGGVHDREILEFCDRVLACSTLKEQNDYFNNNIVKGSR